MSENNQEEIKEEVKEETPELEEEKNTPDEDSTQTEEKTEVKEESDSEKIARLEKELEEEKSNSLRTKAEMMNFRKRQEKERTNWNNLTIKDIVSAFLDPIDNLERSVAATKEAPSDEEAANILKSLSEGVGMVMQQFNEILERKKVICIDPLGETFNPNEHEAYGQIETEEYDEGKVAAVFRKGYKIGDSLIRTATVQIAKKPATPEENKED